MNQDGDSGSKLTVTNFTDNIDPNATPGTSVSPAITPVTPGAATILDSYMATSSAQLLLSNVSVDKVTGKYTADLRVQNIGTTTLSQNLAVLLTGLPTGVTVVNSSGTHPAGSPYLNFNTAIAPGGLTGGGISNAVRVEINDPNLTAFSFKPVVLQGAAAPLPDLSGLSTLTVKVGDKIDIPLTGELAIQTGAKLPTGAITGDSHLVFTPAPDQVGSYTFTLIARNGGAEVSQNITLNVVADPITTTRVTGVIADTNQAGIANVLVELSGYQATTDSSGKFTIVLPENTAGDTIKVYGQRIQGGGITYPFIAEKMGLLLGHDIYRGVNNQIDRPIYLPTIDVSTGTTVNPNAVTIASNPNLIGAQVRVDANSLFDKSGNAFAGILSITEVPPNLTPAALPSNLHPDLVVTIQPGDMVFNTPARLTLPNRAGYLPGLVMDLWSINPNTGLFDIVGKAKVSADGSVIETIEGGIRNSSWHFVAPPPPKLDFDNNDPANPGNNDPANPGNNDPANPGNNNPADPKNNNPHNQNPNKNPCQVDTKPFKSEVSAFSGAVSDDRVLTSYQSQGIARGVNLHYDSLRANPNQIIHVGGQFATITPTDSLSNKITLTANGISQTVAGLKSGQLNGLNGGERMWSLPATGTRLDTSMQVDLSHLASGRYQYQTDTGIRGIRTWRSGFNWATNSFITTTGVIGTTSSKQDKLVVVNDSNSVFGSGWNVSGLQKLVVNEDRSVLLIDGDGTQQIFASILASSIPVNTPQTYQSASGDYSKLERLADGTFQRIMKDGTRYQFDTQGLMVAATDTEGNTTRHIYNASREIQQIVDPVGLTTTFNYTGNRVTSIVDPAGRMTVLEYDGKGNLVSVTDPDTTKNQYGYDSRHLITSSTDKTGQVKTGTYDEFGRAKTAQREDGSIVEINPIEVQGLRNQQQTTNLAGLPTAQILDANPISTYVDGNGNPVTSQLDKGEKQNWDKIVR